MTVIDNVLISVDSCGPIFEIGSNIIGSKGGGPSSYCFKEVKEVVEEVRFGADPQIRKIGEYTFFQCSKLKSVDFGSCKKLESILDFAFAECTSLVNLTFPMDGVLQIFSKYTFQSCSIVNITIPKSVIDYGLYTFSGCKFLDTVSIDPDCQASSLGLYTFSGSSLKRCPIPKSITSVQQAPLLNTRINGYEVQPGSKTLFVHNGCLYGPNCHTFLSVDPTATDIEFHQNVTTIAKNSFMWTRIKVLRFPENRITFKDYALYFTLDLVEIIIPNCTSLPVNVFRGSGARSVTLPPNLVSISEGAFSWMNNLAKLKIPKSVKNITGAFSEMPRTVEIEFENGSDFNMDNWYLYSSDMRTLHRYFGEDPIVKVRAEIETIDGSAFADNEKMSEIVFEGENLTKIGASAFMGTRNLGAINLPSSVSQINELCFQSSGLENISIPGKVSMVSRRMFFGASHLTNVIINEGTTVLFSEAFSGCTSLRFIYIAGSVETIQEKCFGGCTKLAKIYTPTNPSSNLSISNNAFENTGFVDLALPPHILLDGFVFAGCRSLERANLLEWGKDSIPMGTFQNCPKLSEVVFPRTLRKLEESCFEGCGFGRVAIPNTVETISTKCFQGCKSLEVVTFDSSSGIKDITSTSFRGCSSLTRFEFSGQQTTYSEDNGVLYNKETSTLVIYPPGKPDLFYEVPDGIKEIGSFCFLETHLHKIAIGGNLERLGDSIFEGSENLSSVVFSEEIKSVEMSERTLRGIETKCGLFYGSEEVKLELARNGAARESIMACPTNAPVAYSSDMSVLIALVSMSEEDMSWDAILHPLDIAEGG